MASSFFFMNALILSCTGLLNGARLPLDIEHTGPPPVEGMVVMGDMAMSQELYKYLNDPGISRKISGRPETNWPEENGIPTVPFKIRADVAKFGNVIFNGMEHWEKHTCIRFREITGNDVGYIEFINANGCWSYIGRLDPNMNQSVSIGDGCETLGTVVHEIGHAIGFVHEQMRPDRDAYISINYNNVNGPNRHNFHKFSAVDFVNHGVIYDYTSIMQYGGMDFSSNGNLTMVTKEARFQGLLGRGQVLSHRDKHVANIQYKCIAKWMKNCTLINDPCLNKGYLGSDCRCVCPPGTSGDHCQILEGSYYDASLPACSREITEEGEISSPNYPQYIRDSWCVYHIKAPEGHITELKFLDFKLDRYSFSGLNRCALAFLEIRDKNMTEGTIFCGDDIQKERKFTSQSRDMILYLDVPYGRASRGFKATVTFVNTKEPETKVEIIVSSLPQGTSKMTETSEASMKTSTTSSPGIRGNGDAASTCCLCPLLVFILLALNKMYSDHFYYGVMQD